MEEDYFDPKTTKTYRFWYDPKIIETNTDTMLK